MVASTVMVASAALCALCAALSRRVLWGLGSLVMFLVMLDHAIVHLLPQALLAAILVVTGVAVATTLRPRQRPVSVLLSGEGAGLLNRPAPERSPRDTPMRRRSAAPEPTPLPADTTGGCGPAAILCAVSYPAMATLLLLHAAHTGSPVTGALPAPQHHHSGAATSALTFPGGLSGVLPVFFPAALAVLAGALVIAAVLAARRGRGVEAGEAGSMAVMLGAMLL